MSGVAPNSVSDRYHTGPPTPHLQTTSIKSRLSDSIADHRKGQREQNERKLPSGVGLRVPCAVPIRVRPVFKSFNQEKRIQTLKDVGSQRESSGQDKRWLWDSRPRVETSRVEVASPWHPPWHPEAAPVPPSILLTATTTLSKPAPSASRAAALVHSGGSCCS